MNAFLWKMQQLVPPAEICRVISIMFPSASFFILGTRWIALGEWKYCHKLNQVVNFIAFTLPNGIFLLGAYLAYILQIEMQILMQYLFSSFCHTTGSPEAVCFHVWETTGCLDLLWDMPTLWPSHRKWAVSNQKVICMSAVVALSGKLSEVWKLRSQTKPTKWEFAF